MSCSLDRWDAQGRIRQSDSSSSIGIVIGILITISLSLSIVWLSVGFIEWAWRYWQ